MAGPTFPARYVGPLPVRQEKGEARDYEEIHSTHHGNVRLNRNTERHTFPSSNDVFIPESEDQ